MERLSQRMDRIEKNFDLIFVRAQVNGEWQSVPISELPAKFAMEHIFRWLREVMPDEY